MKKSSGKIMVCALFLCVLSVFAVFDGSVEASPASALVRETSEILVKRFGKEMSEEGAENVTKRLASLAERYGDDVCRAAQKTGPKGLRMIEEAGVHGDIVSQLIAKNGNEAVWVVSKPDRLALFVKYGDNAAQTMMKHQEVGSQMISKLGEPVADAMVGLSKRNGRQLAMLEKGGDLTKIGRTDELLDVIEKYGDRGMDFIWKHKGTLAIGTTLAAFLANPEPFIDGTATLAGGVTESALKSINWTPIIMLVTILVFVVLAFRYRLLRRATPLLLLSLIFMASGYAQTPPDANTEIGGQVTEPVVPATTAPASAAPATVDPVSAAPAPADPATVAPATTDPVSVAPATAVPVSAAPATVDPVSAAPAPAVPATADPATVAPATAAPAPAVPTTVVPVSTAPTSTAADAGGDDVAALFDQQRREYGDAMMRNLLLRLDEPAQDQENWLDVAGLGVLLFLIVGAVVWGTYQTKSKKNQILPPSASEGSKRPLVTFGQNETLETDIPVGYVPWFKGMDENKLEKLLVEERQNATNLFLRQLFQTMPESEIPKPSDIEDAKQHLSKHLQKFATNGLWLETINGEPLQEEKQSFLSLHLKSLLPQISLPTPCQEVGKLRTIPFCTFGAVGSFLGFYIGGLLARFLYVAPEAWMMLGAILGTFGSVLIGLSVANNEAFRKRLMLLTGTVAAVDTAIQVGKEWIPIPFGKSRWSFLKRLAAYGTAFICLMLLKRKSAFDIGRYRLETEQMVEQWLAATIPLTRVLSRRVKQPVDPFNVDSAEVETLRGQMNTVVQTVNKLRRSQGEGRTIVVDELLQRLKVFGYEFYDLPKENNKDEQIWEESMSEIYQPFDIIFPGERFIVEKQPIICNGKVEEKGLALKSQKRN